jgi:hypothetical protein
VPSSCSLVGHHTFSSFLNDDKRRQRDDDNPLRANHTSGTTHRHLYCVYRHRSLIQNASESEKAVRQRFLIIKLEREHLNGCNRER